MSKQSDLVSVSQGASGDPLFIDTANNRVGVGTSSPDTILNIGFTGADDINTFRIEGSNGSSERYALDIVADGGNSVSKFMIGQGGGSPVERMRIDTSGNVGIGASSPAVRFHVTSSDNYVAGIESSTPFSLLGFKASNTTGTIDDANVAVGATGDALYLRAGGTERARIDASGNLLVAATSVPSSSVAGCRFSNPNAAAPTISRGSGTTEISMLTFQNGNGTVGQITTNGSATSYVTSSDYRLKENVTSLTGAADRLAQIPVCRFNFIADPDTTVDGFLAHEVQDIVPEAITGTKDEVDADGNPVYQGIDQSKLVPLLTAALQEALTEIASLKARLDAANL